MDKVGIVFSGGGGKGAYQIGVWQALIEHKIKAEVISGTSVGALNGALYLQGDFEKAKNTWLNVRQDNIISLKKLKLDSLLLRFKKIGINNVWLMNLVKTKGLFSQDGLVKMIEDSLDMKVLYDKDIPFYATAYNKLKQEIKYFHVNDKNHAYEVERVKNILLASAAIPIIFSNIEIDGEIYFDGGCPVVKKYASDNSPILPVYNKGCNLIIWISLNRDDYQDYRRFPNCTILPISPSKNLGNIITGTLDFSPEGAKHRMEIGYDDAQKILSHVEKFMKSEKEYMKLWENLKEAEEEDFKQSKVLIQQKEDDGLKILNDIERFNVMIFNDDFENQIEYIPVEERNFLTESAKKLLEDIDRREIEIKVDDLLAKNADNSQEMQKYVMESVSFLSHVESKALEIEEASFLKRIFGNITGRTDKILAANSLELAKAQYASSHLINSIQNKNILSFEATIAVNNKVNRLFQEILSVKEGINNQYVDIYKSLSIAFFKIRKEILKDRDRIDMLEDRVNQLEWYTKVKFQTYKGIEYKNLPIEEKLVCVINDFYNITEGKWNHNELLSLKVALDHLKIENTKISPKSFVEFCEKKPETVGRLLENIRGDKSKFLLEDFSQQENSKVEITQLFDIPTFFFAVELLSKFKENGYKVYKATELEGIKREYDEKLKFFSETIKQFKLNENYNKEIKEIREKMNAFKIKVPLIGVFSCGKTTLLNKYIGTELFNTSLPPETAIAAELHWANSGEEKIIVTYLGEGVNERVYSLSDFKVIQNNHENILCIKVYINCWRLSKHKDIVLVDMPGLDTSLSSHNKAIANYINEGVTFILCIETGQPFKQTQNDFIKEMNLYDLDISVLLTKNEKRPKDELPMLMGKAKSVVSEALFKEVSVRNVSAFKGDLEGLKDIIYEMEEKKNRLFRQYFYSTVQSLQFKIKNSLKLLMNKENLTLNELEKKKRQLEQKITKLKVITEEQKRTVSGSFRNNVSQQVVSDVRTSLIHMKANFLSELKAGNDISERIKGVVYNTLQTSIRKRSKPIFEEVFKTVSKYVSESFYANDSGATEIYVENCNIAPISPIETAGLIVGGVISGMAIGSMIPAIGTVLGGIIGGILGGIGDWLNKSEKERQIKEAISSIIENTSEGVRSEVIKILNQMSTDFFKQLEEKIKVVEKEHLYNIERLQNVISENKKTTMEEKETIQNTILKLENMIEF